MWNDKLQRNFIDEKIQQENRESMDAVDYANEMSARLRAEHEELGDNCPTCDKHLLPTDPHVEYCDRWYCNEDCLTKEAMYLK